MTAFWLHRLLEAQGVRDHVIDPESLQVDRRTRRAKSDGIDVGKLLRSLMAYLRGEPRVWSVVRVPTIIQEDDRRLHRERSRLINKRIQHLNRIKGLLAIHGIYDYEPIHPERIQRLERLRTADRHSLPLRLKAEILRELRRLELVVGMIQTIETERDAIVSTKSKSQQTSAKKIKHLVKLKSIGPEFATVLVSEVFYRTFDNRKQVGSYVGLTPSPFQSGSTSRDQGIGRAGNAKARDHVDRSRLAALLGRVVFGISARRQVAAVTHGDCASDNFGKPAVTITSVLITASERPAANANGTLRPSAMPITTSRTDSDAVKCVSMSCVEGTIILHRPISWRLYCSQKTLKTV